MSANKRLGKWLLYILCLAPAAIMLGYYWLEYIPNQREYFMNLRFRSLAMMGDELRIKIERLRSAFSYAATFPGDAERSQYIAALVPDLTYPARGCAASDLPLGPVRIGPGKVEFAIPKESKGALGNGCPAEASLAQIFTGFTRDDLFEDVLIAEAPDGAVIYQRSDSSPRIAAIRDLLKTAAAEKAVSAQGNGTDADAVRSVLLDGSEFVLLIQPARIAALGGQNLQICGLVSSRRLAREARHVPPEYLLPMFAPLLIVFLSSPLLKILLLTRTGRLAFHDMALLGLFTAIAAVLVTLLLVSGRQYRLSAQRSEQQLSEFAKALNVQMLDDLNRMRDALERIDKALPSNPGEIHNRSDLVAADQTGLTRGLDPFDLIFWANADGCQVAKWTTSLFNFPRVPQISQDNFKNVVDGELWSLAPGKLFTLQTVVSQTTSRLIVIMAMPSSHPGLRAERCGASEIVSVSLVAQLRSLSWPLVPPGAGFAVFRPDGLVLFHSDSDRNLHENLFEEIGSPSPWRRAVAMRTELRAAAYYRGRKFQFHVQPVNGIGGIPWNIAAFQEIEPRQALLGLVWAETLGLFAVLLCLLGLVFLVVVAVLRAGGRGWRQQVDFFLDRLWPGPGREPVFRRLVWLLAGITILLLAVVARGAADAYNSTRWLLPFCLLAPVAALSSLAWRLWKMEPESHSPTAAGKKSTAYFACMSLGLVLVAVVPTLGLWSICETRETRAYLSQWQQALVKSLTARRSRMRADVQSSRALSREAKVSFLGRIAVAGAADEQNYVAAFWQTKIHPAAERSDQTAALPCQITEPGGHMMLSCRGSTNELTVESTLPPIGIPTGPLWWVIGVALAGCAYAWNCNAFGRLFLLDFRYCPLPELTPDWSPPTPPSHLLVLGLPLARKDGAVRQWLGYTPPRVNLYTAQFSEGWIDKTVALLEGQLTVLSAPAIPLKNWVHVSNLETKLAEETDRLVTADLIEKLVMMNVGEARVRLIVTSVVDPISHFDSVLSDERKKIYEHPLPEPELQRLARLLHNFRKVQAPGPDSQRPAWAVGRSGEFVYEECRHQQPLLDVGKEVTESAPPGTQRDVLCKMVAERAQALYKLYWSSSTRSEKLLLIQLAQTGFVNPLCGDTLAELIRKGLILRGRRPRVMNETFRKFLEAVEGPDTVRQWEIEAGESSWLIVRNIVLVLIIVGLGVVGLAQYDVMQTATAALTGVLTLMAGASRLLGYLTGRRAAAPAESA